MTERELIAQLARHRMRLLGRHPEFRGKLATVRNQMTEIVTSARRSGVFEVLEFEGKLKAAFFFYRTKKGNFVGNRRFTLDYVPEPKARAWVRRMATKHLKSLRHEVGSQIDASYGEILDHLISVGLHIDSILLIGSPAVALRELKRRCGKDSWPDPRYSIEPLRSERQAREVLRIIREEFSRNPQYGHFCTSRAFLKERLQEMRAALRARLPREFVIVRDGRVVGHCNMSWFPRDQYWGKMLPRLTQPRRFSSVNGFFWREIPSNV